MHIISHRHTAIKTDPRVPCSRCPAQPVRNPVRGDVL